VMGSLETLSRLKTVAYFYCLGLGLGTYCLAPITGYRSSVHIVETK